MAVVDPQVGTERRAVALRTGDGRLLVGPDNGLLSLAWERAGGVALAVDVTRSPHRLEPVSATFHGRDVFAPVAAHLAAGAELADAGDPLEPESAGAARAPGAVRGGRRARGARAPVRPLRQRVPRRGPRAPARAAASRSARAWRWRSATGGGLATYAHTFADVAAGRAARVRGRLPHAGARGQPRRRRRDARRGAGRRGPPAAADDRHPARPPPGGRLHQRARQGAGRAPGRRTARSSRPTSRPPAAGARAAAGWRGPARRC